MIWHRILKSYFRVDDDCEPEGKDGDEAVWIAESGLCRRRLCRVPAACCAASIQLCVDREHAGGACSTSMDIDGPIAQYIGWAKIKPISWGPRFLRGRLGRSSCVLECGLGKKKMVIYIVPLAITHQWSNLIHLTCTHRGNVLYYVSYGEALTVTKISI